MDDDTAADRLTALALSIALILFGWLVMADWLSMAFGSFALIFWLLVLAWLVCVIRLARRHRRWWPLGTAPIILYPVLTSAALVGACMTGNCL